MRCLVQRVASASVSCNGAEVGKIDSGLLVFVCGMKGDTAETVEYLAKKISRLRIFRDEAGKMNKSILEAGGAILVVSQFTLAADSSRGNRPGFQDASSPDDGERLYRHYISCTRELGIRVAEGVFGGDMVVALANDGPVTIWLEKP